MNDILKEFSSISKRDFTKEWETICWILSSECGWSQEEILSTEIPFVLSILEGRNREIKASNKAFKKR
jgi:hypothetical protein